MIKVVRGKYLLPGNPNSQNGDELRAFHSKVIYTDKIDQLIREHCPQRKVSPAGKFWQGFLYSVLPILVLAILIFFFYSRAMKAAGRGALQFGKSRAKMLSPDTERVTLKDVAGIDEAKEEMQEIVDSEKSDRSSAGGKIPRVC